MEEVFLKVGEEMDSTLSSKLQKQDEEGWLPDKQILASKINQFTLSRCQL